MTCVCADATHSTPQPAKRFHMHAAITALGFLPSQILHRVVALWNRPRTLWNAKVARSPGLRSRLCALASASAEQHLEESDL